jgi:hypothetical protein
MALAIHREIGEVGEIGWDFPSCLPDLPDLLVN